MLEKMTRGQWLLLLAPLRCLAQEKTRQLSAEELEKLLQEEKNLFLLDVREPKEIEELGAVKGYVNIPLSQLEARVSEIPKTKTVVTMCNRGVRAARAAEILAKHGYQVVGACGIFQWKEKKKPVVYPKDRPEKSG